MNMFKKNIVLSAAVAMSMLSSTSFAAEVGSFLVKMQGGYSMSKSSITQSSSTSPIKTKDLTGFTAGVGFGYVASENIWTDVTVSFDSLKSKTDLTNKSLIKVENNNVSGMFNAYYGFNMGNNFSPYVMGGLGATFAKAKLFPPQTGMVVNKDVLKDVITSKNTTYFAYQGGFGIAFEPMKSVSFDLGYRLGNNQGAKFNPITLSTKDSLTLKPKSELKHSILLGVSIAF